MIDSYEKFRLTDKLNNNDVFVEVNWKKDQKIDNCKVVKFILGEKEAIIDVKELNSMLFAIGDAETQRKMIPQTIRRSRWYETLISVKAKKDIKKGENITFPLKITLPTVEEEVISEIKREVSKNKVGLISPK